MTLEAANIASARMLPEGGSDGQERWLAEGIAGVQKNAFYMHHALMDAICNDMTLCQTMFRSWMRKRMKPDGYLSICLVFWLYSVASYIVLSIISGGMNTM